MACTCQFDAACDGFGNVGCKMRRWDDNCFCQCGCETECPGCANCEGIDEDDDERLFLEDEDGNPRGDA